jgi:hypothetical protein
MARWLPLAVLLLTPTLARADQGRIVPEVFPLGVYGFFWGESVSSAKSKCVTFEMFGKGNRYSECVREGGVVNLEFSAKKLVGVAHYVTEETYAQCSREVLEAIGLSGRFERGSFEIWAVTHADSRGKKLGTTTCMKRFEGCDRSNCTPRLIYSTD